MKGALAVAILVCSAGSASATTLATFRMEARGGLQPSYTTGDQIVVDLFLDAHASLTLFSLKVLSTASTLDYCGPCSAALPPVHPGYATNGAQPSYILYAPAAGMIAATIMYPQQTPFWLNFPPPTGFERVGVNYAEPAFAATQATGNNIWIASLVYDISGAGTIEMEAPFPPCFLDRDPFCEDDFDIEGTPIVVNFVVPEPTTAGLIGFGVLGLGLAGSRKR